MAVKQTVEKEKKQTKKKENKFSKKQLRRSKAFIGRQDILEAVLSDDKDYTAKEAEQEILKYMKGKVK